MAATAACTRSNQCQELITLVECQVEHDRTIYLIGLVSQWLVVDLAVKKLNLSERRAHCSMNTEKLLQ